MSVYWAMVFRNGILSAGWTALVGACLTAGFRLVVAEVTSVKVHLRCLFCSSWFRCLKKTTSCESWWLMCLQPRARSNCGIRHSSIKDSHLTSHVKPVLLISLAMHTCRYIQKGSSYQLPVTQADGRKLQRCEN